MLQIKLYSRLRGGEILSFLPGNTANYKWFKQHSKKHKTDFLTVLKRILKRIFWR